MLYPSLNVDTEHVEFKSPLQVLEVPTSDTEPFASALWVLSYLAYPKANETSQRDAFLQAMKFQWQISHVDPKLTKRFVEKKFSIQLQRGGRKLTHRASAGRIALLQIFNVNRDGRPGLRDQAQHERILLGWSKDATESDSTYKSKVWGRSRPVLHIATALTYFHAVNNSYSLKQIVAKLVADPLALIGLLELAENLRRGLPSIDSMYSLDQFVAMYVGQPILIDQRIRTDLRRPVNPFEPNRAGRWAQMSPR
jgi:hypothetical protein